MATLGLWCTLMITATGVGAQPTMIVSGITVDASADSTTLARDQALADGQRRAFDRLLRRLVPRSDHGALPRVDSARLAGLIENFEVEEERSSSRRYIAKLTFRFRSEEIRRLLRESDLAFTETVARPHLVLPIVEAGGVALLWEDGNDWLAAWQRRTLDRESLFPLVVPRGDGRDQIVVAVAPPTRGEEARLLALAERYELRDALLARAVLDTEAGGGRPRLQVTLRLIGSAIASSPVQVVVIGESLEKLPELYGEAIDRVITRLEEDWKRENLLRLDSSDRVSARVPVQSLAHWVDVRRRLARLPIVKSVEVAALSRTDAQIVIEYFGDIVQLQGALGQMDLVLTERDGFWTLSARQPASRTAPNR